MVSDLVDQNPERFAAVTYHVFDDFTVPWGQDRFDDFYSIATTPTLMFDGWLSCPIGDYGACLDQNLPMATDVTIDLIGTEVSGSTWDIGANVCVETGGSNKNLRIYIAATLNHPDLPSYSRNVLMQEAVTEDISVSAGNCRTVTQTIAFDSVSWSNQNEITIIAWAQEPTDTGPADVHQAAIMGWPFPEGEDAVLTDIEITPFTAVLEVGQTMTYTATGKDQNGDDFELTDPVWWTTGDGSGTFDPERGSTTPELTADYPGDTNIICTQDGITGRATLRITGDPPELSSIAISPVSAEMEVGQSRTYTAVGSDQYGDEFPLGDPSWTITGDGSGTFDPATGSAAPLFTATRPGTAAIVCSDGEISGQETVVITGDAPQLTAITLSPDSATIVQGRTQTFSASGTDQYGDPFTLDGPAWSISGEGDGTFAPLTGTVTTLTATVPGSSVVTAEEDGVEGTASVEITSEGLPKPRRVKARHTP